LGDTLTTSKESQEMALTPEEDREEVWRQIAAEHPEFLREYDLTGNYHVVREIVLGGSAGWAGVWQRFTPGAGKKVMDIGANVGIFSAACAARGVAVTAVEPYAVAYEYLLQLERMLNIRALKLAVSNRKGTCEYRGNISWLLGPVMLNGGIEGSGANFSPADHALAEIVECTTLDVLLDTFAEWDCVKIDIEGAECDVINATPANVLRRIKFMYVEFHPWVPEERYDITVEALEDIFTFEGVSQTPEGRWEAAYCTRR
jgi:FkbM family methyltransferase